MFWKGFEAVMLRSGVDKAVGRERSVGGGPYSVKDVAERLGISTKSLYTWIAKFSKPQRQTDQEAEIRLQKKELARVTEERDILKMATAYFAKDAK